MFGRELLKHHVHGEGASSDPAFESVNEIGTFSSAPPAIRQKNQAYAQNIHKRGFVKPTLKKETAKYPVGPILLGFIVFVVIGSSIFEILNKLL
ncbi:ribosome associated membrane protein RAMP4-domain-containing protein [Fimicolochytrium jonesii]|uniref:ribosome associated membrane protein RAMP4-domain-containing protein n=1 Tax=Fimicolochytrium jonesii TaxID=1396493 RepID=UPI0022FE38C8|nr:ribosome associated membrane protein RAMP4-domain-containing protein [Fimicolochytrium jonesii]KAI8819928.1 ribosome associated membrane protein RAMP4-domain-containing protein [Fimicolochytrium jonesii]